MRTHSALALAGIAIGVLAACGGGETEAEREARLRAARADSVAMADSLYDPAVFDTLTWESQQARLERGAVVYRTSCQKCHGSEGAGAGDLAEQMELDVPSFLAPAWPYAGDVEAIRHRIFVGHEGQMPNWGLHGLTYRDADAAAAHIHEKLRSAEAEEQATPE